MIQVIIPGTFKNLNNYTEEAGKGYHARNSMKKKDQRRIIQYLPKVRFKKPVYIRYVFYEPNRRRDKDNISSYFHKIFQDACVQAGVLKNDGWKEIEGFSDEFHVDQKYPRIEIYMEVMKNGKERGTDSDYTAQN